MNKYSSDNARTAALAHVRYTGQPLSECQVAGGRLYASLGSGAAGRWPDRPDVALANLRDDGFEENAARYLKTYGVPRAIAFDLRQNRSLGPLASARPPRPPDGMDAKFEINLNGLRQLREVVRSMWKKRGARPYLSPLNELHLDAVGFSSRWEMVLETRDLWTFVQIALLRDCTAGRAQVCQNPECPAPFFIGRPGRMYCSNACAGPAQRAFKRAWWAQHGRRWRASRTKKDARARATQKKPKREEKR